MKMVGGGGRFHAVREATASQFRTWRQRDNASGE